MLFMALCDIQYSSHIHDFYSLLYLFVVLFPLFLFNMHTSIRVMLFMALSDIHYSSHIHDFYSL